MIKSIHIAIMAILVFTLGTSCVSKKKFTELETDYNKQSDQLSLTKLELASCLNDKEQAKSEIEYLKKTNYRLLKDVSEMATLTKKEAENLEKSLEKLQEKDLTIRRLEDALNKRDSATFALVTQLKGATVGMDDEDISISVEKGVVYVSISDKLLFESGSYIPNSEANAIIAKVAQVIKSQPDMDFMVEGHTDNKAVRSSAPYKDNWELSVIRATSIVRILQNDFGINPKRITAAGRGEYSPLADNETEEGRAKNRRTRIVILPKLDEFYQLIEKGLESAK